MDRPEVMLFEQQLEPADIFLYVSDSLKKKLSASDKRELEKAFYRVVQEYKNTYEQKYLDRILA